MCNELYHYGVKGMKWGVRKDQNAKWKARRKKYNSKRSIDTNMTKAMIFGVGGTMVYNSSKIAGSSTGVAAAKATATRLTRMPTQAALSKVDSEIWKATNAKTKGLSGKEKDKKLAEGYKTAAKVLAVTAGVSLATAVGIYAYRRGVLNADRILKAGTIVQNIGPKTRDFGESFYGTHGWYDKKFYKKIFAQNPTRYNREGRNIAREFVSDTDIKIAGQKAMTKAFNEMKANGMTTKVNKKMNSAFANKIKTGTVTANDYFRNFGALDEDQRLEFTNILKSKGYSGFKDINDMKLGWGDNPTVYFGKDSGLKVIKETKIPTSEILTGNNAKVQRAIGVLGFPAYRQKLEATAAVSTSAWAAISAYDLDQRAKKLEENSK